MLGEGGIPNAGKAVVKEIRTTFEEFLDDEDGQISSIIDGLPEQIKQALTSALDPLEPNSPANRLLNQLGTALEESTNLAKDLGDIFDPNNPKSAISELYRQLNPAIKILYMSGYADNAFSAPTRQKGDTALLAKPFGKADLAQAVRNSLDEEPTRT